MAKHKGEYATFLDDKSSLDTYSPMLRALWYDGNGDWERAHEQVDSLGGKSAARIHAYLHRKEGDLWNADYWYGRAGVKRPDMTLDEEWKMLLMQYSV